MSKSRTCTLTIASAVGFALVAPASAQVLEEITVTAQKREQTLQDVPVAINAFSGEFVVEAGIKNVEDLAGYTPGLSVTPRGETETSVFIRGIGSQTPAIGADPSVGIYVDGVYNSRGTTALSSFFDIQRVEVVKGPQGTLFGRNAAAGAISIITNKPSVDETSFEFLLGGGNEGQIKAQAVANFAVSDRAAIRIGVNRDERDAIVPNLTGKDFLNRDHLNYRISGLLDVTDNWESVLTLERTDVKSSYNFHQLFDSPAGDPIAPAPDVISRNPSAYQPAAVDTPHAGDQFLDSLKVVWTNTVDVNDSVALTSITAYLDADLSALDSDLDGFGGFEAFNVTEPQTYEMLTQEFRLNGATDAVDWFVGASYSREDLTMGNAGSPAFLIDETLLLLPEFLGPAFDLGNGDPCDGSLDLGFGPIPVPPCNPNYREDPRGTNETTSVAVYGDITWHATDVLDVTVGLRYTRDEKDATYENPILTPGVFATLGFSLNPYTLAPVPASGDWSSVDPRFALNYRVNDDLSIFFNAGRGYKSGGLNRQVDAFLPDPQNVLGFDKEKNTSYEIGFKSTLMDGRARVNGSVYFTDYKDFQLERFVNLIPRVDNIGDLEVKGLELEGEVAVTDNLNLTANYAYTDAKVVSSDFAPELVGLDTIRAPEHTANAGLRYLKPVGANGNFKLLAYYQWSDSFYFDAFNLLEQEAYGIVNARVGYEKDDGRWGISVVGENIADENYLTDSQPLVGIAVNRAPGALWRLELTARF